MCLFLFRKFKKMLSNVLDPEDNRGFGRVGGRDRVGQPFVGFADRAAIGQDASLLHRPQVPRPGSHHRLLRRLQVKICLVIFFRLWIQHCNLQ